MSAPNIYSGVDIPMCPPSKCVEYRQQIWEICRKFGWPVAHEVLICDPETGECCFCSCVPSAAEDTGGDAG